MSAAALYEKNGGADDTTISATLAYPAASNVSGECITNLTVYNSMDENMMKASADSYYPLRSLDAHSSMFPGRMITRVDHGWVIAQPT